METNQDPAISLEQSGNGAEQAAHGTRSGLV
jgi:hypothetical protein